MKARKANGQFTKTTQALAVRTPAIDAYAADLLILSSRLAVTRPPVFWAEGELDARTHWVDTADDTYDDNYRRVFGDDPWWDWNWYRDALLADELEAIPVCTLTVVASNTSSDPADPVFDDDPELTARVNALMARVPLDVPAPEEGVLPPTPSAGPSAPGAGTQNDPAQD